MRKLFVSHGFVTHPLGDECAECAETEKFFNDTFMKDEKYVIRQKDKTVAIVLALFLGGFGAHKFYLDRPGIGVAYVLFFWTLIPAFCAFIDLIVLLTMSKERFDQEYNGK